MNKDNLKNEDMNPQNPNSSHHPEQPKSDKPGVNEGSNNQLTVQVRYQSDVVSVTINKNASIEALLVDAIRSTENQIGKKDQFQLKLGGTVLDPHKKISDYSISEGALLVLGLVAGGGGSFSKLTTK